MKKQFIKIFAVFYSIAAFAMIGSAKSEGRSEFEIPFDFVVRNQTYPAGRYYVKRLSPSSPDFLVLRQIDGKGIAVLLRQNGADDKQKDQLRLSFTQTGKTYVLLGIWSSGQKYSSVLSDENDMGL